MARAVFLDRDGTLNEAPVRDGRPWAPMSLEEFRILPEARGALDALRAAGFLLIVATNQPDVGRGQMRRDVVEAMHQKLLEELGVHDVRVCWDGDEKTSSTYKPEPGLLVEAARDHGIDLGASYMVGDRWRDVGCGRAAGCYTVFIDRGYTETLKDVPDARCANLAEAAELILRHSGATRGATAA